MSNDLSKLINLLDELNLEYSVNGPEGAKFVELSPGYARKERFTLQYTFFFGKDGNFEYSEIC